MLNLATWLEVNYFVLATLIFGNSEERNCKLFIYFLSLGHVPLLDSYWFIVPYYNTKSSPSLFSKHLPHYLPLTICFNCLLNIKQILNLIINIKQILIFCCLCLWICCCLWCLLQSQTIIFHIKCQILIVLYL